MNKDILYITHVAGFFSCCSIRLEEIIKYFNNHQFHLPYQVNSSLQWNWYCPSRLSSQDLTSQYFKTNTDYLAFFPKEKISFHHDYQYENYHSIFSHHHLYPFIYTYFQPTDEIRDLIRQLEEKYNLDYQNVCVLFYRGNDKIKDTKLGSYEEFMEKAKEIRERNPTIKFLVQSDETEFLEYMGLEFVDCMIFDEIRHMSRNHERTVDYGVLEDNYIYSKWFLAITIVMSKCHSIILNSGNCGMWIILYRGHSKNVIQYLNNDWL